MVLKTYPAIVVFITLLHTAILGNSASAAFDPNRIQILMNPDLDVIYHTLAHLNVPDDVLNLFSESYIKKIRQAKEDLEVGATLLDHELGVLQQRYREYPRLRFLNRAPFMADDLSSFKQALALIDYNDRTQTIPGFNKGKRGKKPLMFYNSQRLITLFRNKFPATEERAFAKQFASCLEDENFRFYKLYREARGEWDQLGMELFKGFWKRQGLSILWPWASNCGANQFKVFLSPVMNKNGRGVPIVKGQDLLFHVVVPLPTSQQEAMHAFFVLLHETIHRSTDDLVVVNVLSDPVDLNTQMAGMRENAAFYAGYLYLKTRFPKYRRPYLSFFLQIASKEASAVDALESLFAQSYPLNEASKRQINTFISDLH